MKYLIPLILLFPSLVFAVDDATVQAIDSKASNASAKANGNNSRIQALEAEDVTLHQRIDTIQLTPGPKGDKGDTGPQGIQGEQGLAGADGSSCTATQGTGSATISCDDGSMASVYDGTGGSAVTGNTAGDMQYWDGDEWVVVPAPAPAAKNVALQFCNGSPIWGGCPYAIGDTGPAGGIVFYITDGGLHGLEAAPADQSTSALWGCHGTSIDGTNDTAVGAGALNTIDIVANCDEYGTAAKVADAYSLNVYSDWFLPSKDELNLLYGQKDVVGGFGSYYYWSSSQYNNYYAWGQAFNSGSQFSYNKGLTARVRAIRAF